MKRSEATRRNRRRSSRSERRVANIIMGGAASGGGGNQAGGVYTGVERAAEILSACQLYGRCHTHTPIQDSITVEWHGWLVCMGSILLLLLLILLLLGLPSLVSRASCRGLDYTIVSLSTAPGRDSVKIK